MHHLLGLLLLATRFGFPDDLNYESTRTRGQRQVRHVGYTRDGMLLVIG